MSMLSSMCEKLRITADEVKRFKNNNADWLLLHDGIVLMEAVQELRDAADTIDNLHSMCQDVQVENEQLREVADLCSEYISEDRCEGCVVKRACYNGDIDDCYMRVRLINMMRELGIEV